MTNNGLKHRLETLEADDPRTAEMLGKCLATDFTPKPLCSDDMLVSSDVSNWLAEDHAPDQAKMILVLGCPTMAEYLSITQTITEKDRLFILEYTPTRALHFFSTTLIEGLVRQKRLRLVVGENSEAVKQEFYTIYRPKESPAMKIIDTGRGSPEAQSFYYSVLTDIREEVRLDVFNAGTLVCRGPLWQFNTVKNLPHLVRHPGINAFEGVFPDKPAIVVGAGPSLNRALPLLKKRTDHFVIIATGTALIPLRKAGIRPDLVVAVDGSHLIGPQFDTSCDDLLFACSSLVYSDVTDRFRGLFSGGLEASPLDHWIDEHIAPRGMLYAGGTVTCSAMFLAAQMGCNPVCTVGLDLCFDEDGTTHAANSMYDGRKLAKHVLEPVPGNRQHEVFTTAQFKCYIDLVSEFVRKTPKTTFININAGGARIDGMDVQPPEFLVELTTSPFDAYGELLRVHDAFTPPDLTAFQSELLTIEEKLDDIMQTAKHAAEVCNRITMELKAPDSETLERVRPLVEELSVMEDELEEANTSNAFIQMSLWPSMYEFGVALNPSGSQTLDDQLSTFQRFRKLYEQIGGAAKWTRDALEQTMTNLSKTRKITTRRNDARRQLSNEQLSADGHYDGKPDAAYHYAL